MPHAPLGSLNSVGEIANEINALNYVNFSTIFFSFFQEKGKIDSNNPTFVSFAQNNPTF